jgi:hypothetical protein
LRTAKNAEIVRKRCPECPQGTEKDGKEVRELLSRLALQPVCQPLKFVSFQYTFHICICQSGHAFFFDWVAGFIISSSLCHMQNSCPD